MLIFLALVSLVSWHKRKLGFSIHVHTKFLLLSCASSGMKKAAVGSGPNGFPNWPLSFSVLALRKTVWRWSKATATRTLLALKMTEPLMAARRDALLRLSWAGERSLRIVCTMGNPRFLAHLKWILLPHFNSLLWSAETGWKSAGDGVKKKVRWLQYKGCSYTCSSIQRQPQPNLDQTSKVNH